ncbi:rod shape-determining protein MreC [Ulvibacter antarcticus]|uniref:Cell shape-determining protein MreC n=1 Tax=Ulvibacter antarcticus TaxID=442714 RepID=A0A3L9Z2X2_9FLAO|nr:rod shape-determining protein MreC [Ulvibacter antarcticus]RMA66500.1 rod shape-determining protein MreC [Ulvibacter antarcticus]
MQQIIFFFIRNKNFLLFAALFICGLGLTIQSHSFHHAKFMSSANFLSGGVYSVKSDITGYFGLEEENKNLTSENIRLRKALESYKNVSEEKIKDSSALPKKYSFVSARVINNTYSKTKNLLTLKKGSKDGILLDMGVISSTGIVGIVNNVSKNYATVQSILNTNSQINARMKNSNHFGSLIWNTKDPNIVQLTDVNRLAPIKIGDTIITDGKSTIFPEGLLIGTIKAFELGENDSYNMDVLLFNDMTNLKHVYIIENNDAEEIKTLEKEGEDEQ